jgi:hypothetical protein
MKDDGRRLMYEMVANRRTNFDSMLWQVPVLTLTAQAFLFTIALSGDSSRAARVIASSLAIVSSFLAVTLMARHRQAEIVDAHWLAAREREWFGISNGRDQAHGPEWQLRRNKFVDRKVLSVRAGKRLGFSGIRIPAPAQFGVWVGGFFIFGAAAVVILILAIATPDTFSSLEQSGVTHHPRPAAPPTHSP